MRGVCQDQAGLFAYMSLEERVPGKHPPRKIRELVRAVLVDPNKDFAAMMRGKAARRPEPGEGPPEQLLSALLRHVFHGLRSERQLIEPRDCNLLFRWFVGLSPDAPVGVPTAFTKNRERMRKGDLFQKFMTALLNHPQGKP